MTRIAAGQASDADVLDLEQRLFEQTQAVGDIEAFVRADVAFHRAIAAISGNSILLAVSEAMLDWLLEYQIDLIRRDGRERRTIVEHRLILDNIASHDVEAAAAAMLAHLSRSADDVTDKRRCNPRRPKGTPENRRLPPA
jgi:DNA-binding FadR family transcriptional regulator